MGHGLREALHRALDAVLDDYLGGEGPTTAWVTVTPGERQGEWNYTWPDGSKAWFTGGQWYEVAHPSGKLDVLVAWCRQPAWGRDRKRAIVFHRTHPESSAFYPWTEFVETDDGHYGATIPDPARPRASLADGDPLPARFDGALVRRADEVFTSISSGPSLRLIVDRSDEDAMVRHGVWVAELRSRI